MKAAAITSLLLPALALARPGQVLETRAENCDMTDPSPTLDTCIVGRQYCDTNVIIACVYSGGRKTMVTTATCASDHRCYYVGGWLHDGIPACLPCA